MTPDRHLALLPALSEHADGVCLQVDVVDVQCRELGDPETRGIEQLEPGPVAKPAH